MKIVTRSLWTALCAVPATSLAAAGALQSHADIVDVASEFALDVHANAAKVDVTVSQLDTRLQLSRCVEDLIVFWPPGASEVGRTSVGVECPGSIGWKVYVRAMVDVYEEIAVLKEPVDIGEAVSNSNVQLQLANLAGLRGDRITQLDWVMEYRFKRRYAAGRPLTLSMVEPPRLIEKGKSVIIAFDSPQLTVKVRGIALSHGQLGSSIKVKNTASNKVIIGEVVSKGMVLVSR